MMSIAFIAPDEYMLPHARRAAMGYPEDFIFQNGLLSKGVAIAVKLFKEQGVEIFISRGGTADGIRRALPQATVIPVLISGFDLVRACMQARRYGPRIGMVAFPFMIEGVGCLSEFADADIGVFPLEDEAYVDKALTEARKAGVTSVVGGIVTNLAARAKGIPSVVIESGPEAIGKSIHEAVRVAHVMKQERALNSLYRALITHVNNGIVTVDTDARITVINPAAARMARVPEGNAVGGDVRTLWPELDMEATLASGREELGVIVKSFGQDVICNKIPLKVGDEVVGALATCHDVTVIRKMEANVRTRAANTGHRARAKFTDILGKSEPLRRTIRQAASYAETESTVLILGETGTGKELFAQSIHNAGQRASAPFVAVNCAALPGNLLESELFGYAGGAFTSANPKGKSGLLEMAHGGTVFLDEIAELEPSTQSKILRVLQEKQVMRLGDDLLLPVDVRIIAATNKDLRALVEEGTFRADLYYRINVLRLELPPLRKRPQDIPDLARVLLKKILKPKVPMPEFTRGALQLLLRHQWPGNIRELQNIMERIAATTTSGHITESMLRDLLVDHYSRGIETVGANRERDEILEAMQQSHGRMSQAAKLLGMSRTTLWRHRRRLAV